MKHSTRRAIAFIIEYNRKASYTAIASGELRAVHKTEVVEALGIMRFGTISFLLIDLSPMIWYNEI